MGVGLWFSGDVVQEFAEMDRNHEVLLEWREWLQSHGLLPYTLNGFPYSNFHQPVVKYAVYEPNWSHPARLAYTINLITILDALLPEGAVGSISTLPIGWEGQVRDGWADHLLAVVEYLADLEQQTGRLIHLDLEPEPGCEVSDTSTLLTLLTVLKHMGHLPSGMVERYLRVCHDICHSAVMFEPPTKTLKWLRDTGFRIGKVQISNALRAPFAGKPTAQKKQMRAQLEMFNEPRYLHQTTVGTDDGHALKSFYDDLADALADRKIGGYEWRVHFHVPIHLESIGLLSTTQTAITEFLAAIRPDDGIEHFEVETYAWNVLPPELQVPDLADGIAKELNWVREQAAAMAGKPAR